MNPTRIVAPFFFTFPDSAGYPDFRVTVIEMDQTWARGFVEEVTAWDGTGTKVPVNFEHYLSFVIKWDGCSHVNFGERRQAIGEADEPTTGYLHLCGAHFWKKHIQMMAALYRWAKKEIPITSDSPDGDFPELLLK